MDSPTTYDTKYPAHGDAHACAPIPEFRRLNFTYGQLLGVADFRTEQSYFREKQRLHNRCLHGYGVVCGLLVHPGLDPLYCPRPEAKGDEKEQPEPHEGAEATKNRDLKKDEVLVDHRERPPTCITIDCGLALDCEGNELVVRRPLIIDLWHALGADEQKKAASGKYPIYISLCYCEQPVDPFRPVVADQCGTVANCAYGKLRDSVRVHISLDQPQPDNRCETCCTAHGDCCVLLARIDGIRPGVPLDPSQFHNEVRRRLSTYPSTVITGINWEHGAEYLGGDAQKILGTHDPAGGVEIYFSRPVHASCFQRGVVELWRVEGGRGRRAYATEIAGEFLFDNPTPMVTKVRYRQTDREGPDEGDRILLIVRCAFILDHCCRPVDGAHVGGMVPYRSDKGVKPAVSHKPSICAIPSWGYAPWTSGSGAPGSSFESWITVWDEDEKSATAKKE
jgi:hypothetical protein